MKHKWALLVLPLFIVLSGCDSRYRYPCQDPDNWDQQMCKKPWCSADGTCPEDLQHYEKKTDGTAFNQPKSQTSAPTGGCK
jgi:hypothetical protein